MNKITIITIIAILIALITVSIATDTAAAQDVITPAETQAPDSTYTETQESPDPAYSEAETASDILATTYDNYVIQISDTGDTHCSTVAISTDSGQTFTEIPSPYDVLDLSTTDCIIRAALDTCNSDHAAFTYYQYMDDGFAPANMLELGQMTVDLHSLQASFTPA